MTDDGTPRTPDAAAGGPVSHAIFRLAKGHRALAAQLLREVGLHPGQEVLMMRLWDSGPVRQSCLAEEFDTDSASMTRSVQRLEKAGYVRRVPDPADGRATLVEPTPASLGLRKKVERLWSELERRTLGDLDPAQREAALAALHSLEVNVADATGRRCPSAST